MKRILLFIIVLCSLGFLFMEVVAEGSSRMKIKVLVDDDREREIDMVLMENKGYLKIKDVADIFGAKLKHGKKPGEMKLLFRKSVIVFRDSSKLMIINWTDKFRMNKSSLIFNDELWVPLEGIISNAFVSAVKKTVIWNYSTKTLRLIGRGGRKVGVDAADTDEAGQALQGDEVDKTANVTEIKIFPHRGYTRAVIRLAEDMTYKHTRVEDKKLFIKVMNGSIDTVSGTFAVEDDIIMGVKSIQGLDHALIEFELGEKAGGHIIKKLKKPLRITVDIKKLRKEKKKTTVKQPSMKKKVKTVVIDPGHGGKDPGAIGPKGTKEKDIVLKVSRLLARYLRSGLKCRVYMTRTSDIFIPLSQRTEIANQKKADLFISVHANASLKKSTRGFEIYFLSEKASDAAAQAVANIENSVLDPEELKKYSDLNKILGEMAINEFMNDSSEACSFIGKSITKSGKLINRGVRQAGFHVLRGAQMPAVLVECAFISNPTEEKKLKSGSFQKKIAEALYKGVRDYKKWVEK